MRVDMAGMDAALGQEVDPDILEPERLLPEIEMQLLGEGRDMGVERLF